MQSLIEQIRNGALWDFPGGVHPAENKKQSNHTPLTQASLPSTLVLPLKQHIGKAGRLLVTVGEHVLKGQPLTDSDAGFTVPIHAPTSGTVTAIEPHTVAHPSGLAEPCLILTPDGDDNWRERNPITNFRQHSASDLLDIIRLSGIAGMGGAGFPTAKKIQTGVARTEILIVNAAECEPYITADDVLMQTYAEEIIQGIEITEHILKPKLTVIGIEDNKPEAITALSRAAKDHPNMVIRVIPTKYPSGGEKQLIKLLTDLEVPSGGIPADIGILVQNVGSLYAIKRAIVDDEPLIQRIVTLTGNTFAQPRNVWARIGTPVQALLDEFDYTQDKKRPRLIMGGPMMGFTLPHGQVPITKTSNCILAPTRREIAEPRREMACIRCSNCADACPASLLPQQLQWYAKSKEYDKLDALNLKDCIECGACAYVCPSEIPLVQYYRQAKAEMRQQLLDTQAADRAKVRFEEKKARMEREKSERENRFKKAADERRQEMKSSAGTDAIAAAIARVKAQKSDAQNSPVKPAVAAAIANAKAKQAAALKAGAAEPDNSEMMKLREERKRQARERKAREQAADTAIENGADASSPESVNVDKQATVAAAIARAKARKAQSAETTEAQAEHAAENDAKKAAVAAAIARAKARKAQSAEAPEAPVEPTADNDVKKAAVAAAIARAKARKAQSAETPEVQAEPAADNDAKKAAVAAAIARAKARKAQSAETPEAPVEPAAENDAKKAAVAAAIARAKARKAQSAEAPEAPVEPAAENDAKKAAVAAAIARAKARKVQSAETPEAQAEPAAENDAKKAAVAAAIARAKARRAQQNNHEENE
ncbi:electron transport complex subunit RsxC [Vibrio sp. SM6]|uniref:Ion-translocating oxidoreductase complex subunit C n=1 Tax=Vibrio agarilyticus TaxID=2726741 RepID=A0A7X8TSD5_9VIBR|nr:electron transport complex subunit RsxC [Vibrio agarilyticus]NLS13923.1 electron transport complex subunit RsxC [Vibrio agarilyticus]